MLVDNNHQLWAPLRIFGNQKPNCKLTLRTSITILGGLTHSVLKNFIVISSGETLALIADCDCIIDIMETELYLTLCNICTFAVLCVVDYESFWFMCVFSFSFCQNPITKIAG